MTVRLLVVDDHPLFRSGLRTLFSTTADVELVAEAGDGLEAVALAEQLRPDVVLMDLDLPGLGGIEATRRVRALPHAPEVLVLTMVADETSLLAAVRAGARGYLLKGADSDDVLRGVQAVHRGDAFFGGEIGEQVLRALAEGGRTTAFPQLTDRESEVLELLADGATNAAIGRQLHLSAKTVQNYVSSVLTKLQLSDRTAAALVARDAGLGRSAR